MKVSLKNISDVTREILCLNGVSEESAAIIAQPILYACRCDISTHGIRQLPLFIKKIKSGHLIPENEIKIVSDDVATAVLDANRCFGHLAAKQAIDMAIEKAARYGTATVGVRNSNTFGAAGYYGYLAAQQGMTAIILANSAPAIAPTGGKKTIFGTNPICFAFPGNGNNYPVILDMATTVAARSKIRLAAKNGEKIPADWAVGPDGKPTDDPNEALKGSLLPIGGHKGYGLSLFIDLLAGMMTGAAFGGEVRPLSDAEHDSGCGQLFIVIDTKRFLNKEELSQKIDVFCSAVKACGDEGKVFLPGELWFKKMDEQNETAEISDTIVADINFLCEKLGSSVKLVEAL